MRFNEQLAAIGHGIPRIDAEVHHELSYMGRIPVDDLQPFLEIKLYADHFGNGPPEKLVLQFIALLLGPLSLGDFHHRTQKMYRVTLLFAFQKLTAGCKHSSWNHLFEKSQSCPRTY